MQTIVIRPPLTVEIDIPVTRRLKLHAVTDVTGTQIFHSRRLSELFSFLADHEVGEFTLVDGDAEFRVSLTRPPLAPLKTEG